MHQLKDIQCKPFNLLFSIRDQLLTSLYNVSTLPNKQVMRISSINQ